MFTYDCQIPSHLVQANKAPSRTLPQSLMKWPGNKAQELSVILPLVPPFRRYYDPFVGGGAVFFALKGAERYINDKSSELIALYQVVAQGDEHFFRFLELIIHQWIGISSFTDTYAVELIGLYKMLHTDKVYDEKKAEQLSNTLMMAHATVVHAIIEPLSYGPGQAYFLDEMKQCLLKKMARMHALEKTKGVLSEKDILENLESALKSAFYSYIRHLYNHMKDYGIALGVASAIFYFIRENAYASMFRYNHRGEFNAPYGGITYSRKNLARKVEALQSTEIRKYLAETVIENTDFEQFLRTHTPGTGDFIFLDPPYQSHFSTYSQHEFGEQDHARLAAYVCSERRARWMLVVKKTPGIQNLYQAPHLRITSIDKRYQVCFQGRNDRSAEHLIITNY